MAADGDQLIGSIMIFAGNFVPRSWAFCDGQLLAISTHSALFSILGTTYGGDGRTTFALPDLRGRVPIGPRTGPGLSTYGLGQRGGEETHTLTLMELASHSHIAQVTPGSATLPVNNTSGDEDESNPSAGVLANTGNDVYSSTPNGHYGAALPVSGTSVINQHTGGTQWHTNIQPFNAINYIIALQGLYPSRN